jgi:pimeloyl-ACP methyl ester carboxylesterase
MTSPAEQPSTTQTHQGLKVYFQNPEFDGQLLRAIGYAGNGGADYGECLSTAYRIAEGDHESWYREWTATADRIVQAAEASAAAGHTISAREGYLRAANYYRTSYIFMFAVPLDPRMVQAFQRQRDAFRKAAALISPAIEPIEIPFEGTTLPGYFYCVDESGSARQTLIVTGGYDGTVEESYFGGAAAAWRRGYNVLAFDGPGEGGVLLEQRLAMRPDWEKVVTPVVDYALSRPEVDPRRMALIGRSWGGYLAPRAAAFEHRLAALIADPGLYSLGGAATAMFPQSLQEAIDQGDAATLKPIFDQLMQNPSLAFTFNRGMLVHGVETPWDYIRAMAPYTLEGLAPQITCPTLITQAENDLRASQSKELVAALTCPKTLVEFTNAEGAGEHCEAGAGSLFAQRAFDWLDGIMAARA